jgi:hypothetical protein
MWRSESALESPIMATPSWRSEVQDSLASWCHAGQLLWWLRESSRRGDGEGRVPRKAASLGHLHLIVRLPSPRKYSRNGGSPFRP